MNNMNVGTRNLPDYIRIILSQTPGVCKAAETHDKLYDNPYKISSEGKKIKLSRKDVDKIFRNDIFKYTENRELADAYYKAIRKTGAYGWYRVRIGQFLRK
jgi:hypothetical protein